MRNTRSLLPPAIQVDVRSELPHHHLANNAPARRRGPVYTWSTVSLSATATSAQTSNSTQRWRRRLRLDS